MSDWFKLNGLLLNPSKSDVIITGTRHQIKTFKESDIVIKIAGAPIVPSETIKLLGVTFDSSLNMKRHVDSVCQVTNFHVRALKHIRKHLDVSTANSVACSMINSRLDYCNSVLAGTTEYNLKRL